MGAETRPSEFRPGQWLTTCALHPFTFWSGDTFIDANGNVRCQQFCGKYKVKTTREQDAIIAATHHLREAPSPPHTRPRHGGEGFERPYARWKMQKTPTRLEDFYYGHDGVSPAPASVVSGRAGPAFLFDGTQTYEVPGSSGANPITGLAIGVWAKLAAAGTILSKRDDSVSGFSFGPTSSTTFGLALGAGLLEGAIPDTGWHYYAASWDLETATLYVDGLSVATGALAGNATTAPMRIGTNLVATLSDLRYYQRPLETGELAGIAA